MSLSNKLSITDVDLKGKRVLIRVSRPVLTFSARKLDLEANANAMSYLSRSTSTFPLTLTRK
jgi:hypothetical protein